MKAIDVFILTKYGHKISPLFYQRSIEKLIGHNSYDLYLDIREFEDSFKSHPPKTRHIVHGLYDMGFRPSFIAELLNVSQSNVSYHLSNPLPREYRNATVDKWNNFYNRMEKQADYHRYPEK